MDELEIARLKQRLATLSTRQRQTLGRVCQGMPYKDIAAELVIAEGTVKTHMSEVYIRLGLDQIVNARQRQKKLREVFCPIFDPAELPPPPPEADSPKPVPAAVLQMVEYDQRALVVWQPQSVIPVPTRPVQIIDQASRPGAGEKPPHPLRWMVLGMIVGIVLVGGILWVALGLINRNTPVAIAQVTATPLVITSEVLVVVTQPPPTPEVVVITATLPPRPTRTHTPRPMDTPTPTVTPGIAAGTILKPGEVWHQDGMEMRLYGVSFLPGCNGFLGFEINLVNKTGGELVINFFGLDMSIVDDLGREYRQVWVDKQRANDGCYRYKLDDFEIRAMAPSERLDLAFRVVGDTDTSVSKYKVVVHQAGRIQNATWEIEVPK